MKSKRGGILVVIGVGVVAIVLLMLVVMPFILIGGSLNGDIAKSTGAGGSGCFISDEAFVDTSVVARKEAVISQITAKWPKAATNERYIREVFDRGAKEGINPLIPLAIWAGEQTFDSPEKAFGYGYTDGGTLNGVTGWDAQLNGVYGRLKDVINNTGLYTKPSGGNRFTRLFYNYTSAMRWVYENSGNIWQEDARYKDDSQPVKARLAVFRLVANDQIICQARVLVAGTKTGNDGVPLYRQADYRQPYGSSTIAASGCCTVSATMVMNYYNLQVDPIIISTISARNGFYIAGQGTDHNKLYPFLATRYRMSFDNLGNNWDKALKHLKNKQPIIARGEGGEPYTSGGHCIVITGYDEKTQMVRVNNPARGDGPYPLNLLREQTTVLYFLGQQ